jgi:hypothetical protein
MIVRRSIYVSIYSWTAYEGPCGPRYKKGWTEMKEINGTLKVVTFNLFNTYLLHNITHPIKHLVHQVCLDFANEEDLPRLMQ